jgi:hypothetical protein
VNMLYLFGIRRRLNFVTQPWSRQLDVEQWVFFPYCEDDSILRFDTKYFQH